MSIERFALSGGVVFNVYAIEWLDRRTVETIAHDLGLGVGPQDAL